MIRYFIIVTLAVALALTTGVAQEKGMQSSPKAGVTLQEAAANVLKHEQALEACIRDNKTDDVKKHAEAMLKAAKQTKVAAEKQKQKLVARKADEIGKTAKELVSIGGAGTIAEHGQVIMKAEQQARSLVAAANQPVPTTSTLLKAKP